MFFTPLCITNKMQRYTIFFLAVNALHVSGGFSAHHQELKLYIQHLVYVMMYLWLGFFGLHRKPTNPNHTISKYIKNS
jgi:hypothetical protein